ncbi:hypothetical protein [Nonomuraea sp. NPDC003201]
MVRRTRFDLGACADEREGARLGVRGPVLIKVLAVTTALYLALSGIDRLLWLFVDDERTALVYGTAARVANPDKRLSDGHGDAGWLLHTTYTLQGEPRLAGPSKGWKEYEIVPNWFGTVRAPSLDGPSAASPTRSPSWRRTPKSSRQTFGRPSTRFPRRSTRSRSCSSRSR